MSTQLNGLCGSATGSIFDRRILRRVALDEGPTGEGVVEIPQTVAAVVDVEPRALARIRFHHRVCPEAHSL